MSDEDVSSRLPLPKSVKEGSRSRSPSKEGPRTGTDFKKQRGVFKARLSYFDKFIAKFQNVTLSKSQLIELNLRTSQLESIYKEFNEVQTKIEDFSEEKDLLAQMEYRENFEEQNYGSISIAKSILYDNNYNETIINSNSDNLSQISKPSQIKLPDIKLPTFDGSYDDWLEYKNSYITMIHKRTDLDGIQKFHYLRSSLSGGALQVISALEFTPANYVHAWDLLVKRFQNDRLLVQNHVKSLFSLSNMHKESPVLIRKVIDTILRNLRALSSLGEPTESWDTLIIYLVVSKLDSSTEREWEDYKGTLISNTQSEGTKRKLKLDDLLTFLRNRADLLETIHFNNSNNSNNTPY